MNSSPDSKPISIRTKRLFLRPFTLADAPAVRKKAGAREIADTTLLIPHPYEDGLAEKWIREHTEAARKGTEAVFAITLQESRELIGAIGLSICREHERAELGYWIEKTRWGQGYATEAVEAILKYSFVYLQLHRVYAHVFARNRASARVLLKNGLAKEGTLPNHIKKWGTFEDLDVYGILSSNYIFPPDDRT